MIKCLDLSLQKIIRFKTSRSGLCDYNDDAVMPVYGLLEYSKNYSKTSGSLWNYYRDEPNNPPADNYNEDPITNSTSFKCKSSIT